MLKSKFDHQPIYSDIFTKLAQRAKAKMPIDMSQFDT